MQIELATTYTYRGYPDTVNVITYTPYSHLYYYIPVSMLVLNEAVTTVTANFEEAVGCIN